VKKICFILAAIIGITVSANAQLLDFFAPQAPPQTTQEAFIRYMRGGYLTSGSYYQFLNPGKGVEHLEAASLTALRYSWNKFGQQENPAPSPMVTLGILDNIAGVQGSVNGDLISTYLIDIGSLTAGYTVPLFNYGAYLNIGLKAAATYNTPYADSTHTLGTDFLFVESFDYDGTALTKINRSKPYIGLTTETAVRFGVRVYYNWFVSLALGVRHTPEKGGRWFQKSDLDSWQAQPDTFDPIFWEAFYWTDKKLPENNFFVNGNSYFLHLSVSPFF